MKVKPGRSSVSAAALIHEGYSGDDGFLCFRLWLVAHGRAVPMSDWDEERERPWLEARHAAQHR
ncbi:DUF4240 domain-containing protein [Nonomuraea aridisoli]|uniref:DUF4240 domain-containing protein n=1 Tax=Nonomuraea aridisoli TaxID=2070368 RepID=A0A2W2DT27_9ACTN|nr:DUF4240 domain-containing protein [Nonomuraea aridisoli]PZG04250.1 hypothetical protein C1J01_44890 [Nonomuraea aridisoli]